MGYNRFQYNQEGLGGKTAIHMFGLVFKLSETPITI